MAEKEYFCVSIKWDFVLNSHFQFVVCVFNSWTKVFKDGSRNPNTFKMELFAKICNGRVYNQWTVFACHCGNSTSLQAKLKSNENGHALKAASDTISSFADMFFIFFQKC